VAENFLTEPVLTRAAGAHHDEDRRDSRYVWKASRLWVYQPENLRPVALGRPAGWARRPTGVGAGFRKVAGKTVQKRHGLPATLSCHLAVPATQSWR
jgi:hypothetical protein